MPRNIEHSMYKFNPGVDDRENTALSGLEGKINKTERGEELAHQAGESIRLAREVESLGGAGEVSKFLRKAVVPKRLIAGALVGLLTLGAMDAGKYSAQASEREKSKNSHVHKPEKRLTGFDVGFKAPKIELVDAPDLDSDMTSISPIDSEEEKTDESLNFWSDRSGQAGDAVKNMRIEKNVKSSFENPFGSTTVSEAGEISHHPDRLPYAPDFVPEVNDADEAVTETVQHLNQAVEDFAEKNDVSPNDVVLSVKSISGIASFEDRAIGPQTGFSRENIELSKRRAELYEEKLSAVIDNINVGQVRVEAKAVGAGESIMFRGEDLSEKQAYELIGKTFGLDRYSQVDKLIRDYNDGKLKKLSKEKEMFLEELLNNNRGVRLSYELQVVPNQQSRQDADIGQQDNASHFSGGDEGKEYRPDVNFGMSIDTRNHTEKNVRPGLLSRLSGGIKKVFKITGPELSFKPVYKEAPVAGNQALEKNKSVAGAVAQEYFIRYKKEDEEGENIDSVGSGKKRNSGEPIILPPLLDDESPTPVESAPSVDVPKDLVEKPPKIQEEIPSGSKNEPFGPVVSGISTGRNTGRRGRTGGGGGGGGGGSGSSIEEGRGVWGSQRQSMRREKVYGKFEKMPRGFGEGAGVERPKKYARGPEGKLKIGPDGFEVPLDQHPQESPKRGLTDQKLAWRGNQKIHDQYVGRKRMTAQDRDDKPLRVGVGHQLLNERELAGEMRTEIGKHLNEKENRKFIERLEERDLRGLEADYRDIITQKSNSKKMIDESNGEEDVNDMAA